MIAQRTKLDLGIGRESFWLRWDMHAIATFERIAGVDALAGFSVNVANVLDMLWSALDADAAARNEVAPVPHRQWATLFAPSDMQKLVDAATELLRYSMPEPEAGKAPARKGNRAKKSRSRSSTSGARSTSASPSASSGASLPAR